MSNEIIQQKKIMFLITGSDIGGAEIVVKNLIFNLDQNRFSPIFVSIRPLGKIGKEVSKISRTFSLGASKKFNPLLLWRLWSLLRKERPAILHCHLFHANFLGRIIGTMARIPFIISTVHSDNFGSKLRYFLLRITDRLNDMTVAVSEKIKNDLIKNKITNENKVKVIYNGIIEYRNNVPTEEVDSIKEKLNLANSNPIILSVGRLDIVKGHIYLVRAVKLLKEKYKNLKLILIGDGPERRFLEKEVWNLNLTDDVLFLGEITDLDVYYQLANIFVLPSINEGFGLAALEAMSNRLLVVASQVGGIPEIIQDKISGFMFQSCNPEELSIKIDQALSVSTEEKEKIINNAYNNFKENFSLDKMLDNYYKLY
ncbi:MAG: glycosyltransferase [Patescibacteria group bacterium]